MGRGPVGAPAIIRYVNNSASEVDSVSGLADDMVLIKTITASSDSTIDFVNGTSDVVLDSTYPVYLFKIINIHPATAGKLNVFFRDGDTDFDALCTGTNTSAYQDEAGTATSLYYENDSDATQSATVPVIRNLGNDNDGSCAAEIYLFNPSSTTFVKNYLITGTYIYGSSYGCFTDRKAGYVNTATAIDGVQFAMASGNIDSGTFKLYGIKDA